MSNIEAADRELFDSIAKEYTEKDLIAYCAVARKLRLDRTLKNIAKPIPWLFEVGCGAGFSAKYLRGDYQHFIGLDYSEKLIEFAKNYNSFENTTFVCENIKDYNSEQTFDVIFMIGVLHHIPEAQKVIEGLKPLLNKDGVIVVNEPQKGNPVIGLLRSARKFLDSNYSSDQIEFSAAELRELFLRAGYSIKTSPQGVFSTPLAETKVFPNWIGSPLSCLFKYIDPVAENLLSALGLSRLAWNIVLEARLGADKQ